MVFDLDDLSFGHYRPGKVLVDSGLFRLCQRGRLWDWYYLPTSNLWSLFSRRPVLEELLPALAQFVFAEAMKICTLGASARREWTEPHLRAMGITESGLDALRLRCDTTRGKMPCRWSGKLERCDDSCGIGVRAAPRRATHAARLNRSDQP